MSGGSVTRGLRRASSVAASVLDTIHEALEAAGLGARQRERAASPEDEPGGAV